MAYKTIYKVTIRSQYVDRQAFYTDGTEEGIANYLEEHGYGLSERIQWALAILPAIKKGFHSDNKRTVYVDEILVWSTDDT